MNDTEILPAPNETRAEPANNEDAVANAIAQAMTRKFATRNPPFTARTPANRAKPVTEAPAIAAPAQIPANSEGPAAGIASAAPGVVSGAPRKSASAAATSKTPRKLILRNNLSPGDIIMLTAALRDLHLSRPGEFITDVQTSCRDLWQNNPYVTALKEDEPGVEIIDCEYPLIQHSRKLPYHFIHGFRLFLCDKLKVDIQPHAFKGDLHLTAEEKGWKSQVDEITGMSGTRFWIIVSGGKKDFTTKWWDPTRYQEVVDHFQNRVLFVQCGAANGPHHVHRPLKNVIDLVGKTDLRQMVRLMYHASGVVCPVTMFMHMAAAVETKPGSPASRPCVVIAGGREPVQWEMYPHHQYLHRNGCLPCCDSGGCWKSRTVPLGDGDTRDNSLCLYPVKAASGMVLPKCQDMISSADVIHAMEQYLQYESYAWRTLNAYVPETFGAAG